MNKKSNGSTATSILVPAWAIKASFATHQGDVQYWQEFARKYGTSHSYYSNIRATTQHWVYDAFYRVTKSCQQSIYALLSHLDLAQCMQLKEEARDVYDGLVAWKSSQLIPTIPYLSDLPVREDKQIPAHKLSFYEKENPQETFSELWNKLAAIQYDIGELTAKVNKLLPQKKKSFFNFKK